MRRFGKRMALRWRLAASVLTVAVFAAAVVAVASGAPRPPVLKAGNPSGIVFAHGSGHGPPPGHGKSPDLIYHTGTVMNTAAITSIFWGNWSSPDDKISGLDTFYGGISGSKYLSTNTEYGDPFGDTVKGTATYTGQLADANGWTSRKAPTTADVLSVVSDTLAANSQKPVADGYYPVYSDQPRGHNSYCAWHSWGTIGGVLVQFAFFFNLDNDPSCTPQNSYDSSHSQGLAALANVSGHELSEALTDPHGDAWYDSSGEENADKCAWTFSGHLLSFGSSSWQIQGNWSNNAYDNGQTGYASGGCIDGS